jgi:predicted amidophosphoribosyltransferase
MICSVCDKGTAEFILPPMVCEGCRQQVLTSASSQVFHIECSKVYVAFRYEFLVRTLMSRAKIRNDIVAMGQVIHFVGMVMGDVLARYDQPGVLVVAAPSSSWGRMRGRFDLAQAMALALLPEADFYAGRLVGAFFRKKRAGRNRAVSSFDGAMRGLSERLFLKKIINLNHHYKESNDIKSKISSARRILVVDDILTTGFTMGTIISQLKKLGAQSIEGLVAASPRDVDDAKSDVFQDA